MDTRSAAGEPCVAADRLGVISKLLLIAAALPITAGCGAGEVMINVHHYDACTQSEDSNHHVSQAVPGHT